MCNGVTQGTQRNPNRRRPGYTKDGRAICPHCNRPRLRLQIACPRGGERRRSESQGAQERPREPEHSSTPTGSKDIGSLLITAIPERSGEVTLEVEEGREVAVDVDTGAVRSLVRENLLDPVSILPTNAATWRSWSWPQYVCGSTTRRFIST